MSVALTSNMSWASGEQITAAKLNLTSLPGISVTPSADFFTAVTGVNTYIGTLANLPNPIPDGLIVQLKIPVQGVGPSGDPRNGSNTGPSTLQLNVTTGAKDIVKPGNIPLANGDIRADSVVTVVYNATKTQWYLQTLGNPGMENITPTSVTDPLGTNGLHYKITIPNFPGIRNPLSGPGSTTGIAIGQQITFKSHYDSIVSPGNDVLLRVYTDLLNNSSLAPQIPIKQFGVSTLSLAAIKANQIVLLQYDSVNDTTIGSWQMLSQASNVPTAVTTTIAGTNYVYTSGLLSASHNSVGVVTVSHGLGAMPTLFRAVYVCTVTDSSGAGYTVGDEIPVNESEKTDSNNLQVYANWFQIRLTTTSIIINQTYSLWSSSMYILKKTQLSTPRSIFAPNFANEWNLKIYVFKG